MYAGLKDSKNLDKTNAYLRNIYNCLASDYSATNSVFKEPFVKTYKLNPATVWTIIAGVGCPDLLFNCSYHIILPYPHKSTRCIKGSKRKKRNLMSIRYTYELRSPSIYRVRRERSIYWGVLCILSCAISKYPLSSSIPMKLRLRFLQATPVVPLPIQLSNTKSPTFV